MADFCIIFNNAREKGGRGGQRVSGRRWEERLISVWVLWMLPMSVLAKACCSVCWHHCGTYKTNSLVLCGIARGTTSRECHRPCAMLIDIWAESWTWCALPDVLPGPSTWDVKGAGTGWAFPSLPCGWFFFSLFRATGLHKTWKETFLRLSQRPFSQHQPQDSEGGGWWQGQLGSNSEKVRHPVLCAWDGDKLVCSYPVLLFFFYFIPESCTSLVS